MSFPDALRIVYPQMSTYNLVLFSLFFTVPGPEIIFEHLLEAILTYVTHIVLMCTIRKVCGFLQCLGLMR